MQNGLRLVYLMNIHVRFVILLRELTLFPGFYFRLFQLNPINSGQWFTLPNAYKGCTKTLPAPTAWANYQDNQADPSLFSYCACCGDYTPDPELGCPVSPLQLRKLKF
jgi:hypothetical protein